MKVNTPVTNQEREMVEGTILVSKTDLKGTLTYINQDFLDISGFTETELIGSSHNIVRHPDMPQAAFQNLWDTVKQGLPWEGIVKNRCKNGDYYWVHANVIPITESGQVVEYMSVRSRPSRQQIEEANALYRAINAGQASLEPSGLKKIKSAIVNAKVTHTLYAAVAMALSLQLMLGAWLSHDLAMNHFLIEMAFGIGVTFLIGQLLKSLVVKPLYTASDKLKQMTEGNYFDWVSIGRTDEIGALFNSIKTTQVILGFEVINQQQITSSALRVKSALDHVTTNVTISNSDNKLIFMNKICRELFNEFGQNMASSGKAFEASDLIGTSLADFFPTDELRQIYSAKLDHGQSATFSSWGRTFKLTISPVYDAEGHYEGRVTQWVELTEELTIEEEFDQMVSAANAGDLSQRMEMGGKQGFYKRLSEQLNGLLEVNDRVVKDTVRVFSALAQGDLTQTIDASYDGAFGEVKTNANATVEKLTSIMSEIRESAENVKQGADEIAQGNLNLSERTEAQAASLEETAASMEEMTGTVRHNSDNSQEADELASATRSLAEKGGDAANEAVTAMKEINTSSRKIADIIGVIDEIAFQTNLLALNAAVEAAHAGDQGRGFAVVASEVRVLAQRSAGAAKEIKELIEDSVKKVDDGSHLVKASGETLTEIIASVKKVSEIISEISSAGIEQTTGIEQTNKAILHIDETTQQNTALVEETAAASESLGEQSQKLSQMVSFFRFDANAVISGEIQSPMQSTERRTAERPWSAPNAQGPATASQQAMQKIDSGEWEQF